MALMHLCPNKCDFVRKKSDLIGFHYTTLGVTQYTPPLTSLKIFRHAPRQQ